MTVSTLNTRSVRNKATDLLELIAVRNIDMLGITETWLGPNDIRTVTELTSTGYRFIHNTRIGKTGGGVGLLYKSQLCVQVHPTTALQTSSFEHIALDVQCDNSNISLKLVVVYRPPATSTTSFFEEFSCLLEEMLTSSCELVILGDFNIRCDQLEAKDTIAFNHLLESCDLKQHVTTITHCKAHVLDLVITRSSTNLVKAIGDFDPTLSDHSLVSCCLDISKPGREQSMIEFTKISSIDPDSFGRDIQSSTLQDLCGSDFHPDMISDAYNKVMEDLLEKHAPLKCKSVTPPKRSLVQG